MENGDSQRTATILLVICILLSGCNAGPDSVFPESDIKITNTVDQDCDDVYSSISFHIPSLSWDPGADYLSATDPRAVLYYVENGDENVIKKYSDPSSAVERDYTFTASDFGNSDSSIYIGVKIVDIDLVQNEKIEEVLSEDFRIESEQDDRSVLNPRISYSPTDPQRGSQVEFTHNTEAEGCPIQSYKWDLDGDGEFDKQGKSVIHRFDQDGYHKITLQIENTKNATETTTKEILIMHDPDGDGITTSIEKSRGLDPNDSDTDDDLIPDGVDPFPRNPFIPTGLMQLVIGCIFYISIRRV